MPRRIQHHYLPASYLRNFAEAPHRDRIWVGDKTRGLIFQTSPKRFGKRRGSYAVELEDGDLDFDTFEQQLAAMEHRATVDLQTLLEIEDATALMMPDTLPRFIATLTVRGPWFRRLADALWTAELQQRSATADAHLLIERESFSMVAPDGLSLRTSWSRARELLQDGWWARAPQNSYLKAMVEQARILENSTFADMQWMFVVAVDNTARFWTSDRPVVWVVPTADDDLRYRLGALRHRDVQVTIPLSKGRALFGWRQGFSMPRLRVQDVNQRTHDFAERFVVSSTRLCAAPQEHTKRAPETR